MSDYPKIIERTYKVYTGVQEYVSYGSDALKAGVSWTHRRSYWYESNAEDYAQRISEDYELVKIEKVE